MSGGESLLTSALPPAGVGVAPHVVITSGKGGVGKTTVSIMLADALARGGHRVLVVSLDQAMHLLEYLGLPRPHRRERVGEGLWAMQFDLEEEAGRFTEEYKLLLQQIMPGLKVLNLEKYTEIVKSSPGFEEEVYLRFLARLYGWGDYDYIVVDTPPTGITLRILGLPRTYVFWLERLIELRERIAGLRYTMGRLLGEEPQVHDPALDKMRSLREKYSKLAQTLSDPTRTSYVVVATPEPLPVYEAGKTLQTLARLGGRVRLIVANKVLPPELAQKLGVEEVQRESLEKLASMHCPNKDCLRLAVKAVDRPPHTLEGARGLLDRVVPLESLLPGTSVWENGQR